MTDMPSISRTFVGHPGLIGWDDAVIVDAQTPEALVSILCNHAGPFVLRGFHGTTHRFDTFSLEHGQNEGHLGPVLYLSTSPRDAWSNYALESGPDVAQKIARIQEYLQEDGMPTPEAKRRARRQVLGSRPRPRLLECAVRVSNPFVLGGATRWKIPGLEAYDDLLPEGVDPDDEDAWFEAFDARVEAQAGILADAFSQAEGALGLDMGTLPVPEALLDHRFDGTSQDLEKAVREDFAYLEDPETGDMISGAIVSAVIRALGFDCIFVLDPAFRFKMDHIDAHTVHVHTFATDAATVRVLHTHTAPRQPRAIAA